MGFSKFIKETNTKINIGEQDFGFVNEASFSAGKLRKVAELYGKILGRQLGGEFKVISEESFKNPSGAGKGIRTMNNAGAQIRFNFDEKLAKYANNVLTSLDYWTEGNRNFEAPDLRIIFHPEANVQQILGKISRSLKARKIVESLTEVDLTEANQKEVMAWVKSKGLPGYLGRDVKRDNLQKRLEKEGLTEEFKLFLGEPEKNSFERETLQVAQKTFDETRYADPETVFEDMEQLVQVVAKKKWKSLVVCGAAGVGKCVSSDTEINFQGL